jgi:hypothetical protein
MPVRQALCPLKEDSIMRQFFILTACGLMLGACTDFSTGPVAGPEDLPINWFFSVGLSAGDVVSPPDGVSLEEMLQRAWEEQQSLHLTETALLLADDIRDAGEMRPAILNLDIALVWTPDQSIGKPDIAGDGAGGFVTVLVDALRQRGLTYVVISELTAYELSFDLVMLDGTQQEATFLAQEFALAYTGG